MRYFLVTLTMLLGALGLLGYTVFQESTRTVRRIQSQNWPTTVGVIESAELNYLVSRGRPSSVPRRAYLAEVTFRYTVDDITYQDTDQYGLPDDSIVSEQKAQAYLDRFPPNSQVEISYHPNKPNLATLDSRIEFAVNRTNALLGVPFALFMVAIFGFAFSTAFPLQR